MYDIYKSDSPTGTVELMATNVASPFSTLLSPGRYYFHTALKSSAPKGLPVRHDVVAPAETPSIEYGRKEIIINCEMPDFASSMILEGSGNGVDWERLTSGTTGRYVMTDRPENGSYCFRLYGAGLNLADTGAASEPVYYEDRELSPVVFQNPLYNGDGTVTLSWSGGEELTGQDVWFDLYVNQFDVYPAGKNAESITVPASAETAYVVKAYCGFSEAQSNQVSFIPDEIVAKVFAGEVNSTIVTLSGKVYGTGTNMQGQLGVGSSSINFLSFAECVGLPNDMIKFASIGNHAAGLSGAGQVYTTGVNSMGQLGLGDNATRYVFTACAGIPDGVINIACGSSHIVALTRSGKVYVSGANHYGQLGVGDTTARRVFTECLGFPDDVVDIASINSHVVAITQSGKVYTAGFNSSGQLGVGDNTVRNVFTECIGISGKVTRILSGISHTLALTESGKVYATGNNGYGQLGVGDNVSKNTFIECVGITGDVIALAGGGYHTVALTLSGKVYATGRNNYGQLGVGNTADRNVFAECLGLPSDVISIYCGDSHIAALTRSGKIYTSGRNDFGQLGVGDSVNRSAFTECINFGNVVSIACGDFHLLALTKSGKIYSTGMNTGGQLGLGDLVNREVFTLCPDITAA